MYETRVEVPEFARRVRVLPKTVHNWQTRGWGPKARRNGPRGSRIWFVRAEVDRFLDLLGQGVTVQDATGIIRREFGDGRR